MFPFYTRQTKYLGAFKVHNGPTACIAFSPNGKYMAAGGHNGLTICDTSTRKRIEIANQQYNERSKISALCWVASKNEVVDTLCYGNVLGFLVFLQYDIKTKRFQSVWSKRVGRGTEILHIAVDKPAGDVTRLAVSTRDKYVQIWTFTASSCSAQPILSKAYTDEVDIIPKTVAFDSNVERDFFVFGLLDGNLYKYGGTDARDKSSHQLGSSIGNAAIDLEHRICVVDNIGDGFDIYKLDNGRFELSLTTKESRKTYPKGVAFASQARIVVGGSDHGLVYIFDRRTGKAIATLKHAKKGGAEIIATYDCSDGTVLIATGTGTIKDDEPGKVCLWKWSPTQEQVKEDDTVTVYRMLWWLIHLVTIAAALAFVYDKLLQKYFVRNTGAMLANNVPNWWSRGSGTAPKAEVESAGYISWPSLRT